MALILYLSSLGMCFFAITPYPPTRIAPKHVRGIRYFFSNLIKNQCHKILAAMFYHVMHIFGRHGIPRKKNFGDLENKELMVPILTFSQFENFLPMATRRSTCP